MYRRWSNVSTLVVARRSSGDHSGTSCSPLNFQKLRPAETDLERERAAKLPYLQLIGSLLYLSCMTRPDLAYHMSVLCSLMHDPTVTAYTSALELLAYAYQTQDSQIRFSGKLDAQDGVDRKLHQNIKENKGFAAYSDASWHKPDQLGFNMFGYVVFLYGGPVSYAAKRLKIVALSSAEAEYAAAAYTCKEVAFVRNVCSDLGIMLPCPSVMCVDNQAAIKIAQNSGVTGRNKHFEDGIHYFRHQVDHQRVVPTFVTTKHQRADGFTKALEAKTFKEWRTTVIYEPT